MLADAGDYGITGLIDIPTARMQQDATLTATVSTDVTYDSLSLTYQATPWLEANFRYSGSANVSRDQEVYYDRNYGFKVRLFEETSHLPQFALGVRDLIGTGIFASEYVVASKRFGRLDLTGGLAWGRLAGGGDFSNPLSLLDDRFNDRPEASAAVANAGTIRNFYFRGDVGLFAGAELSLSEAVRLVAEYNPDQYLFTRAPGLERAYRPPSPFSYGITWRPKANAEVALNHQHLDEVGISFKYRLRTNKLPEEPSVEPFVSSLYLNQQDLPPQIIKTKWYDRLLYDTEKSGLLLVEATLSADLKSAQLVVGNPTYRLWGDALGLHIALADLHLPASVETLHFITEDGGHRAATLVVPRPSAVPSANKMLDNARVVNGRTLKVPQYRTEFATGKIQTSVTINQRLQLFDPDDPARFQLMMLIGGEYLLNNHWLVRGGFSVNLTNNFDESNRRDSDSELPNVRTDIVKYLQDGATGLENLTIEGRDTLGSSLHYRVFAGFLEQMYSGAGGEVLWWDSRSRFAVGASIALVRKRDFNKRLSHLDYEALTGFVSGYWATSWYNFDAAMHIGQYLAEDFGATLELRRTFRNGWQIGVFASKTNVSSKEFGEGSFDKGFYFQLPIEGLFSNTKRAKFATRVRPVLRDGGQRLEDHSGNIFWDLREARYDSLVIDGRLVK